MKNKDITVGNAAEREAEPVRERPAYTPAADIHEKDGEIHLYADMPGVDAQSLEVTLENGVLHLRGRVADRVAEGYRNAWTEFEQGDWARSFRVSETIDAESIRAEVKDGVVHVIARTRTPAQRRIPVQAG